MKLFGVPVLIISDYGMQFTSHFYRSFQKGLGTKVSLSTAFHPYMNGKLKSIIQTLEDMLWAYMIDYIGRWV